MGRKQARIDRRLEKQIRQQEKAARLVEAVKADHAPRIQFDPDEDKAPRTAEDPQSIMRMRMEFRIHDYSDRNGEWSWGQARDWCDAGYGPENACIVRATMIEMSGLYWHEIMAQTTGGKRRRKKHHPQSWDSICAEAQERWFDIGRFEDELFRFRTGGRQRIWGFRTGHVFNLVWWDKEHKIYPVD
ncbi:hypothetical protein AB9E14_06225 [Rhizobium leguminosarum]|uniref:hypothetical protein n=1 Tax=Rhizobium leguminosarum TaxID=384 RepID=UPI003F9640EA